MLSEIEYMLTAMLPITLSARMTTMNFPKPWAGVSISASTPPTESLAYAASHNGTLGTAPPIAAPRIRRRIVGITIPKKTYEQIFHLQRLSL